MTSSIVFLSDCTPLYTTVGAPGRITNVSATSQHQSVRLVWSLPPNSNEVVITSFIVRYGKFGAPGNLINGIVNIFLPTVVIPNLENGVLYSFWVSAKNPFGESPLSPVVSAYAGSAPSQIEIVRRSYSTTSAQNVGIEFTPSTNNNGNAPTIFTIKYQQVVNGELVDNSYSQVSSIQRYEEIKDASNNTTISSNGIKGNFINREVVIPSNIPSGTYRFTVVSTNIYGTSAPNKFINLVLPIQQGAELTPSFSYTLNQRNIYSITPFDRRFQLKWWRYTDTVNQGVNYTGWTYRIQYTDNKDYWYYPSEYNSIYFPEYTVPYNDPFIDADGIHTFDISKNVVNGRRYYVRYCVVDANGIASRYTEITDQNLDITSVIPGKPPNPPPIFYAAVDDRLVRLYFNWNVNLNPNTYPPSLDLTGGYPIIGYRIDRFTITRPNNIYTETLNITYDNIRAPYYEDTFDILVNGNEYVYRVYTKTGFGISTDYTEVKAIPTSRSDVVHSVVASVGNNQITLEWMEPTDNDPDMVISQYFIQYRIYDIFTVSSIPSENIVGVFTDQTTIVANLQNMNSILVDDVLWASLKTDVVETYTSSVNLSYTITDLINGKPYVFRVAAVSIDRARRKMVGLIQVIDQNSPYLPRPIVIGVVPQRLSNIVFTNQDGKVKIDWNSNDLNNTQQNILRFHVDYRIAGSVSDVPFSRQSFDYANSLQYKDSTTAYFSITVLNLLNNVPSRPSSDSDSYEMFIFAENTVGYTNQSDKIRLHDLRSDDNGSPISFFISHENVIVRKYVRPTSTADGVNG